MQRRPWQVRPLVGPQHQLACLSLHRQSLFGPAEPPAAEPLRRDESAASIPAAQPSPRDPAPTSMLEAIEA
eukprot:14897002-Alexandrium_andersonii.AAC.1